MLYANAVKPLCKTENFTIFLLNPQNDGENSQKNQHRSAKAANFR